MPGAFIRREEIDFLLRDWLKVADLAERPEFAEHSQETFSAILDLSQELAASAFAPHYKKADQHEPRLEGGKVVLIDEIKTALQAFADAGFFAAPFPVEHGGLRLPNVVSVASMASFMASNIATAAYPMLTMANARLLVAHGNERQIEAFAVPEIAGRYFGTMCMSEPQAGSSLSDIKTSAVADGEDEYGARYRISGSKMWISGAEHDMAENIVHLVLAKAKTPGGELTPGVKGISLFVVPKFLPNGDRNDVTLTGLNHKMGYRGTVNCLIAFGEQGGATGWRIGEEGEGLKIMFHMMNEARIMVGLGAAALAYRGFQQSLEYAANRPQGRPVSSGGKKNATESQVAIIEHADVKRMLIAQKAIAEGALALVLYCARLVDEQQTNPDANARREATELLDLLTPVAKAWPSEFGLIANDMAIQIHGGYGYTRDFDVEQVYRDNRLNPIHEGTNGIQALDLLGRKLLANGPGALDVLDRRVSETLRRAKSVAALADLSDDVAARWKLVGQVVHDLSRENDRAKALTNASRFLNAFGHVVIAWILIDLALTAAQTDDPAVSAAFRAGKLHACRYFIRSELPHADHWLRLVETSDDSAVAMPTESF